MRLTFLGTGTSFGVPVVGCDCPVCASEDPRDQRTRHAALLTLPGGTLLVDTPPELRLQLLASKASRVDAVWFTHVHADHIHGIDDLRIFSLKGRGSIPAYGGPETVDVLRGRFPYIFDPEVRPPRGTSKPEVDLRAFDPDGAVDVLGHRFLPLTLPHGPMDVHGFRVGDLGYVTDAKRLPEQALERLAGVHTLVLNALWWGNPHPTHFNVEEAIEAARQVGADRTYLVHLTHRQTHADLADALPPDIRPAYDGLSIEIP